MKTIVSLDFKHLSEAALAQFSANVLVRTKDNSQFPTLQNALRTDLQPAYDRYVGSLQAAADGSRIRIAEKRTHRLQLLTALDQVAGYLNLMPGLADSQVLAAGFLTRRRAQRSDALPEQVRGLRARTGSQPGEVLLDFDRAPQAVLYGIEWSNDGGQQWYNGTYASAARATLKDLPNRQEVLCRVFAIGTQQRKGAPSVAVPVFVL